MPSRYHEFGSGLFQLQIFQFAISVIPRAPDSFESTSNPAAATALSGMVQGSHGSSATGVATTEVVVGSASGALSVAPPHPATDTITPTRPATHHRVTLTPLPFVEPTHPLDAANTHLVPPQPHTPNANRAPLITSKHSRAVHKKGVRSGILPNS